MPRKVHIATTSGFPANDSAAENQERALRYVEAAGQRGADLVCLPEGYPGRTNAARPEQIPGKAFDELARLARQYSLWVVAGLYVSQSSGADGIHNCAVVIDRQGELAGCYTKMHPTIDECHSHRVIPGSEPTVVDTDFGRLGLAICYDIGWPEYWADLARLGAELVVWLSAYDGGFPLSYYAWNHHYQIVSSVRTDHSRVLDITGSEVASTNSWRQLTDTFVDLEQELFHADYNEHQISRVESEMGNRITIKAFGEERFFTLASKDPDWPVARIVKHYGLEPFHDYYARATGVQEEFRNQMRPAVALNPPPACG
jgi:predicted amidohydrolase